jgi:protein-disulfide isomerase
VWVGAILAVLGLLVMVVGLSLVYVYANRFTSPAPPPMAAPVSPPPVPVVPPPLPPVEREPQARADRSVSVPFVASRPFPEDSTAAVPVTDGRPLWGERDTPVTLTVFGDFECPHTHALLRAVLGEKARRGNDLRLVFRHFPLSQHAAGKRAAEHFAALYAAHGPQAFWRALSELLHSGGPLREEDIDQRLGAIAPELSALELEAEVVKATLDEDRRLGVSLFVRETPTVFVNGVRLEGFPSKPALGEVVDKELKAAYLALAGGMAPSTLYRSRTLKNLVNLGEDPAPRACVRAGESPSRGAETPLVTVVEFSEFECELCQKGAESLRASARRHAAELRTVWKNFPLPQHRLARRAAGLALEARRIGGDRAFFAVADTLLAPGAKPDDPGLTRAAERSGLDVTALLAAARGTTHDTAIDGDLALGRKLGVTGAPTYFVNGRKVPGALSSPELEALLREELALARRVRAQSGSSVLDLACGERTTPAPPR